MNLPIHQSHQMFNLDRLIDQLLRYKWQHECQIIPNYMPPFPQRDARPKCVVGWHGVSNLYYLRHSLGPGTGTFWDNYGDDFLFPELALIELSKACPPPDVGRVIPLHGKSYIRSDLND